MYVEVQAGFSIFFFPNITEPENVQTLLHLAVSAQNCWEIYGGTLHLALAKTKTGHFTGTNKEPEV